MCRSWPGWWLGLPPARTILLCVSVVTRCCEDGEQMEANCSWSVQYHASGGKKKNLKKNYTSIFSAFALAAKFWYWNEAKCRAIKESDIWRKKKAGVKQEHVSSDSALFDLAIGFLLSFHCRYQKNVAQIPALTGPAGKKHSKKYKFSKTVHPAINISATLIHDCS